MVLLFVVVVVMGFVLLQIEVHDGDSITILDNSDPQTWKVRHASGAQAHLPAICCVIPPPDKEALLSAARCVNFVFIFRLAIQIILQHTSTQISN